MISPKLSLALFLLLGVPAMMSAGTGYRRGHRVSVNITPTSSTLQVGQSQQFSARVSNTTNTAVNWLVNGVLGGNSSVGTVSSAGLYQAPSVVPSTSVRVTAQSAAYTAASASATVSIASATTVSVTVSPVSTSLPLGQSQQFSATVAGTSNTAVNWLVNGALGGNSTVGTISTLGTYTAPSSMPSSSVTVTAQSTAQSSASANASVSLTQQTVSVAISPLNVSLQTGQSQQFSAAVSGTSNTGVNWLVSGILGGNSTVGTVSGTGLYTAPGSVPATAVRVTAQSISTTTSSASASVTISQPVAHSVTLTWTENASGVAGYYIYRGSQPTGPFSQLNSSLDPATTYTDSSVSSGQTYYYTTTAVNSSGTQSGFSNVAQATIP